MNEAADERRYERAETLKGYRDALTTLAEGRQRRDGETHAVAVGPDGSIGRVIMEKSSITEKKRHPLAGESASDRGAVSAFVQQFYSRAELPERIVTEKVPHDDVVLRWLESESTTIEEPTDGRDRVLVDSARSAATPDDSEGATKALEEALGRSVERIEGFDISHTGGKETVGSNVTFEGGTPEKGGYRHKTLGGNDDYRNTEELLRWRGERARDGRDRRPDPDLFLIDGGKKQVKAAVSGLDSSGWDVSASVLGIVKPEDRIVGSVRDPDIPEEGRRLLASVRDEAHRFAKKGHTKRRDTVESVIEDIDGVGPALRNRIVSEFTVEDIKGTDTEELRRIEGVGPALAQRIKEELNEG